MKLRPNLVIMRSTPSFRAKGTVGNGAGISVVPGIPAGVVAGDILFIISECDSGDPAPSSAGYTDVTGSPIADLATQTSVLWKRAVGGDTAPTVASAANNHLVSQVYCFTGCRLTDPPFEATQATVKGNSTTTFNIPGVTTLGLNRLIIAIAGTSNDALSTTEFSAWTNANLVSIPEIGDVTVSDGNGGGFGVAAGVKLTAGATGNTSVTEANGARGGLLTIALVGLNM